MLAWLLALVGLGSLYPEFLASRPGTERVLEVSGVKFVAFINRSEVRPGARIPLCIVVENARNTSRLIRFQITASAPGAGEDAGLDFMSHPSADLKDGETGLIVVPVQASAQAAPGPRTIGVCAQVRYENLGQRTRPRPRRGAATGHPDSPFPLPFQVIPGRAAGSHAPATPPPDFSYFELWNPRDLPGPKTIVDQVWSSILVIVSKQS